MINGTCLDVSDTAVNAEHFRRPGVSMGDKRSSHEMLCVW